MSNVYQFPSKPDKPDMELNRYRCKLIELQEVKEAILREIRVTKDIIKLLEGGSR